MSLQNGTSDGAIESSKFSGPDYGVFAGMLAVSAVIGVYYAFADRKSTSTQDFLMGNRSMGVFPVALSLLASFLSAITLLGLPTEIYTYGTQYWMQVITYPLIMFLTSYFFIPVFYELKLTSSYEYLELRFNRSVRILGSALFIVQMIFYMAVVLYAPSLALAQVTGLNVWFSVLSIGVVCTFYTAIGGMKAVIWTDVFQTLIMFGSMLAVLIKGLVDVGGFSAVYKAGVEYERFEFFYMDPNPLIRHTFWSVVLGSIINWTAVYATNQAMVQRYLSTPTLRQAKLTVWVVLPFLFLMITVCCSAGLVIFTKYQNCDPVSNHQVGATDQLFPHFVIETLGFLPGFPGLFVAGVFSGALSTVSSGVNSLAAVTLEDFVRVFMKSTLPEKKATIYTKLIAVFYGLLSIALVAVAQHMGNVLQAALAIFGLIGAPIFAMFIMGMFMPAVNSKGALWGTVLGIAASLWVGIGGMIYKPYVPKKPMQLHGCSYRFEDIISVKKVSPVDNNASIPFIYRLSYMYYGVLGAGVTIIVGYLISVVTKSCSDDATLNPNLLAPIIKEHYKRNLDKRLNPIKFETEAGWLRSFSPRKSSHFVLSSGLSSGHGTDNAAFVSENIPATFQFYRSKENQEDGK